MKTPATKLMTRERARVYLQEVWGMALADSTLANLAGRPDGPKYALINGRAYYRPEDLDAWLNAQQFGATP